MAAARADRYRGRDGEADETASSGCKGPTREADDGSRTRDLELGKLALYQLSYVRAPEP